MLWYAIQSYTGKEEQLAEMIRRMVPDRYLGECFVPYFERLRNWHQQNQVHILRLFPGYLFISTEHIGEVFQCMKDIPAMAKVLTSGGFEFTPLYDSEAEFLGQILDADHIVRLTYAATDGNGNVTYMAGPLEKCRGRIECYKFRERYAQVRLTVAGMEKTVRMGIILDNDIRRELSYGKVEARIPASGKCAIAGTGREPMGSFPQGNVSNTSLADGNTDGTQPTNGNADGLQPAHSIHGNADGAPNPCPKLNTDKTSQDAKNAGRASKAAGMDGSRDIAPPASCPRENENSQALLQPGDHVAVVSGAFEGTVAAVREVRDGMALITVHMFGREIPVEVSADEVRKL